MKITACLFALILTALVLSSDVAAQADDAAGLPIPIGAPVIFGQVELKGLEKDEPRPSVFVSLLISGTQVDRRQTDARGYYFFLERPRHGHTLVFEVNGSEVGRVYLTVGTGPRMRQDVSLDVKSLNAPGGTAPPGSINANAYKRSSDAEKAFDKAMTALREEKLGPATSMFKEIVAKDANDFMAWTMLGTIYFTDKKFGDAENSFKKALELNPGFNLARINHGRMELSRKNFDKAIEILSKAIETDANSAEANHLLGEAYLQTRKGSLAVGYLNKAIELAPKDKAEIHLRLAALYDGAGAKGRAAAEYKAFLAKVPNYADKKKLEQYIKDNPAN
ncbi:MAG: tetratricopeptide repeat protein [Pyrinomonadaceae bacterium]